MYPGPLLPFRAKGKKSSRFSRELFIYPSLAPGVYLGTLLRSIHPGHSVGCVSIDPITRRLLVNWHNNGALWRAVGTLCQLIRPLDSDGKATVIFHRAKLCLVGEKGLAKEVTHNRPV